LAKTHYSRSLPHLHPPGETLFVTFRLAGSLPIEKLRELRAEQLQTEAVAISPEEVTRAHKRHFARWDTALHAANFGRVDIPIPYENMDQQIVMWLTDTFHKAILDKKLVVEKIHNKPKGKETPHRHQAQPSTACASSLLH
jgi:hypothetical protein